MTVCPVLMVGNRKGGTGKSTTAVNLAAELAARGRRTLLVDLDTQGHAGLGVGLGVVEAGASTVHDLFRSTGGRGLSEAVRPTPHPNLSAALADPLFDGIGATTDHGVLGRELRALGPLYDLIVLDAPPSLDIVSMNGMTAATHVLVPLVPHALGLEGVQQVLRMIFRFASGANPSLRLMGLVPVMVDGRINLHRAILDDLIHQFGEDRLFRGIRSDIRLAEAFRARQPIRAYAPRSRGALDYHLLADQVALSLDRSRAGNRETRQ